MSIVFLIVGAAGAVLSVAKDRHCFIVWFVANGYWIWFNWPGVQSFVFVIMSMTCIVGWWAWKKDKPARKVCPKCGSELSLFCERDMKEREEIARKESQKTITELTEEIFHLRKQSKVFRLGWSQAQHTIIGMTKRLAFLSNLFRKN